MPSLAQINLVRKKEQRRRDAWRLLRKGASAPDVASLFGVNQRTIRRWRAQGKAQTLAARDRTGRPPRVQLEQLSEVLALVTRRRRGACRHTRFARWVRTRSLDGFIKDLKGAGLLVTRPTVRAWLAGRRSPSMRRSYLPLKKAFGNRLSIEDLSDHYRAACRPELVVSLSLLSSVIETRYEVRYSPRHLARLIGEWARRLRRNPKGAVSLQGNALLRHIAASGSGATTQLVLAILGNKASSKTLSAQSTRC
jgi:transposase